MLKPMCREFAFHEQDFQFLASFIQRKTGIMLAEHKKDMVYARIARRLRYHNLQSFAEYCTLLESGEGREEIGQFVNAITTNLTGFFREPHHFDYLRDRVLKPLVQNPPPDRRIRLWSAGCSSGAEAYSMAMICCESIPDIAHWDVRILASDIDTSMLARAEQGEYHTSELDHINKAYRLKYTQALARSGIVSMNASLRKLVAFRVLNLIEPWPFKRQFHVIFCRNVVIYFGKETQRKLFQSMANRLPMGGILCIGHSETLYGICDRFELVGKTIYRRIH